MRTISDWDMHPFTSAADQMTREIRILSSEEEVRRNIPLVSRRMNRRGKVNEVQTAVVGRGFMRFVVEEFLIGGNCASAKLDSYLAVFRQLRGCSRLVCF